ncbi:hypothetical protein DFH11DRAFT_1586176, partial [Phellopilus nigrolimitatus]
MTCLMNLLPPYIPVLACTCTGIITKVAAHSALAEQHTHSILPRDGVSIVGSTNQERTTLYSTCNIGALKKWRTVFV